MAENKTIIVTRGWDREWTLEDVFFTVTEINRDGAQRENRPNSIAYKTSKRTGYVPVIMAGKPDQKKIQSQTARAADAIVFRIAWMAVRIEVGIWGKVLIISTTEPTLSPKSSRAFLFMATERSGALK